jgi:hypothetical protein
MSSIAASTQTSFDCSRFSDEEIVLLEQAPLVIFLLVAKADNLIDNQEIHELIRILLAPGELYSDLFQNIINNCLCHKLHQANSDQQRVECVVSSITRKASALTRRQPELHYAHLIRVRDILADKATDNEAEYFKLSLFHMGHRIAGSSGSGLLGWFDKVSGRERKVLQNIVAALDIKMSSTVQKMLRQRTLGAVRSTA